MGGRTHPGLAAPLAACVAVAACVGERERLDVPRLVLRLDDSVAAAGDSVRGRVDATDGSGLVFLGVYACTRDSIFRERLDLDRADSAGFAFALRVAGVTPVDAPVRVYAVAVDDQNFSVDTSRILFARTGVPPAGGPDSGAGLCGVPDAP